METFFVLNAHFGHFNRRRHQSEQMYPVHNSLQKCTNIGIARGSRGGQTPYQRAGSQPIPGSLRLCRSRCGWVSVERLIDSTLRLFARLRCQVALRHADVRVAQPVLNGTDVNAAPQAPRCERIAELVKPEVGFVHPGSFRDGLQSRRK